MRRWGGRDRGEAVEEEMVVVRHGGVVEYWCGIGIAGVFQENIFWLFVLIFSACRSDSKYIELLTGRVFGS
jgi:hypothetical protein